MKKITKISLCFIFILPFYFNQKPSHIIAKEVTKIAVAPPAAISDIFPDPALANLVAQQLAVTTSTTVTQNDLNLIYSIQTFSAVGMKDLTGIEYLQGLTSLRIYGDPVDLSILETISLPQLSFLDLSDNGITQMPSLDNSRFPRLVSITIAQNPISDLNFLKNLDLTNMLSFHFDYTNITNFDVFANVSMPSLSSISFSGNQIENIDVLTTMQMPQLEFMTFEKNQISDLSPLKDLNSPKLRLLGLGDNNIDNISIFKDVDFPNLFNLSLPNNNIVDITTLAQTNFPLLELLDLGYNHIQDINSLVDVNFLNLNHLSLNGNEIEDIHAVEFMNFPKLTTLNISHNLIQDIEAAFHAQNIPQMMYLYLNNNNISTLPSFENITAPSLTGLYLNSNHILDTRPITKLFVLPNLNYIDVFQQYLDGPLAIIDEKGTVTAKNILTDFNDSLIDVIYFQPLEATYQNPDIVWNAIPDGTTEILYFGTSRLTDPTGNKVVYLGGFVTQKLGYQFTFNNDGTTETVDIVVGDNITAPSTPFKEGYTFEGWFDANDNLWDFDTIPTKSMTLFAHFTKNDTPPIDPTDPTVPTQPVNPENPNTPSTNDTSTRNVMLIFGFTSFSILSFYIKNYMKRKNN